MYEIQRYEDCSIVLQTAGVRMPGHHRDDPD